MFNIYTSSLRDSSLMENSSVSEAVVLLARALEDNTLWLSLQKYTVEMACMFLENIILILVIITKVEKKEATLRQR